MSSFIPFIDKYNEFIERTMMDEEAFLAEIGEYITDDSILDEPESIPGLGHLVGVDGWNQWRRTAFAMAVSAQPEFTIGEAEYFEKESVVLRYYTVTFSANAAFPDGFATSIIERYEFAGGTIARLAEYYADTTAFARYFAA
jgi:hypothetical protein